MNHEHLKPSHGAAVAVQMVQLCVLLSKHTGRQLGSTVQLTSWVAAMDSKATQLNDGIWGRESFQMSLGNSFPLFIDRYNIQHTQS